jgi:ABC-type uncharacterized transport system permease subunit
MEWQRTLIHTGFLLSLGSGIGTLHYLLRGSEKVRRIGLSLFVLGTASSACVLALRYAEYANRYPGATVIGPCETLLLLSFSVSLFALAGVLATSLRLLPLVAAPLAGILTVSAAFTLRIQAVPRENVVGSFPILHILSGILSYSAFALLLVVSAIYLVVERELKRKHLRPILERVPSLRDLGRTQSLFLGLGFVFLTLLVLLGAAQVWKVHQPRVLPDPKVLFAAATWLVYGILLGLRLGSRLRGHRMAVAAIWATLLIVLTFLSELPWRGWHNFLQKRPQEEEALDHQTGSNPKWGRNF